MKEIAQTRRTFLRIAGSLAAANLAKPVWAADGNPDIQGLREKIEHVVVIYQENRSFDHYFGTYRNPRGGRKVNNLLNAKGELDPKFVNLQRT